MWDPYAEFETATLPNGLTVHATNWPGRPWEYVGFLVHVGAKDDPIGLEGLAHFVEHVVSNNVDITHNSIKDFFDDNGGSVNLGVTSFPCTEFRFFVPISKNIFAEALSIFGRMLFSAKLEKLIERERQVIIEEFQGHYPFNFKLDLDVKKHKILYAGHCLERSVRSLGFPESIERITQADLQAHYDEYYTPANISIVGVGGLPLSDLVELLNESPLAINKHGSRVALPRPMTKFASLAENRCVFELSKHMDLVGLAEIGGYKSTARIPGNIGDQPINLACDVLNRLLNEELRERRAWTYDVHCSRYSFCDLFEFSINCDSFALTAIDEIEKVIEDCIMVAIDRQDLFEQAKKRVLLNNFMVDLSGKNLCNNALDDLAFHQRIITLTEWHEKTEKVTMDDIRDILQYLQPEKRWTLIFKP
ncbi:MAG: pitrilysin family protein [bacterium]